MTSSFIKKFFYGSVETLKFQASKATKKDKKDE